MDNSTHNMSEILVQYLDGELGLADQQKVEKQLTEDPSLANELKNLQLAREAVKMYGMQEQVKTIHKEMMQELQPRVKVMNSKRRILRYSISIAASILLIAGLFFAYNLFTLSKEKVFASNYHTYELATFRDSSSAEKSSIEKAFRDKQFKEVVGIVKADYTTEEHFLRGISFLEIQNNASAINEFRSVVLSNKNTGSKLFEDEAEYYLALAYLRNGDYKSARELFQQIRNNPDHLYHDMITARLMRQVKMLSWK